MPPARSPASTPTPMHLAIMQPPGYVHALGFLDPARYLRWQFERLGVPTTLAKNRLREGAVNIVFGAHLGFPPAWRERHACLFFNLEQLGEGGASLSGDYAELLRTSAVIDYDARNVPAYATPGADLLDVPVLPFLHAPYLREAQPLPLRERPIDLLFFGSLNEHRRALIARVEACGWKVSVFDQPLYGPERDAYIRQAKAVLNTHFYPSSRFEQVRASLCLSLGTPVISERVPHEQVPAAFEAAVTWLTDATLETFFTQHFGRPAFFEQAEQQLAHWAAQDDAEPYADLLAFAQGFWQGHAQVCPPRPWQPTQINLGSGKDYKPGWLNLDVLERAGPDVVLDLGQAQTWPQTRPTCGGGQVELRPGHFTRVYANNVLEHVPDLPMLMGNVLALLAEGGVFEIEVPYERALTAWQDPTHVRAMNENSWLYYTDWFWYLGWFEHRFEISHAAWLDAQVQPCDKAQAAFMKLTLTKVRTTPAERTRARTMRADFGPEETALVMA